MTYKNIEKKLSLRHNKSPQKTIYMCINCKRNN